MKRMALLFLFVCISSLCIADDYFPGLTAHKLGVLPNISNVDDVAVIGKQDSRRVVGIQNGILSCYGFTGSGGPVTPLKVESGVFPVSGFTWIKRYRLFSDEWIAFAMRLSDSGNGELFVIGATETGVSLFPFGRLDLTSSGIIEDFGIVGGSFRSCTVVYRKARQIESVLLDFDNNLVRATMVSGADENVAQVLLQREPLGGQIPVLGLYRLLDDNGQVKDSGVVFKNNNGLITRTNVTLRPIAVESFMAIPMAQNMIVNTKYIDGRSDYQITGTSFKGGGFLFPAKQNGDSFLHLSLDSGVLTVTQLNAALVPTEVLMMQNDVIGYWIDPESGFVSINRDGETLRLTRAFVDTTGRLSEKVREININGSVVSYIRADKLDILIENESSNTGNLQIINEISLQSCFQTSVFTDLPRDFVLAGSFQTFECVSLGKLVAFINKEGTKAVIQEGTVQANIFSNSVVGILRNDDGIGFKEYVAGSFQ